MITGKPSLRGAFDRVERAVGAPLEDLVASRKVSDLAIVAMKLQGAVAGAFERQTRTVLHFWNLPARSDLHRMNRQVAALTSEVRRLAASVDAQEEDREHQRDA